MFFAEALYVGVNPSSSGRPMQYVALDGSLQVVAHGKDDLESVLAFIAGLESAIVAVDAPQAGSQGVMARPDVRERYDLPPDGSTWSQWRLGEYELRRRNIRLVNTATLSRIASNWLDNSARLYARLKQLGFRPFRVGAPPSPQLMLELQPHAGFSVLLERQPFSKDTLEGRLQRQLVLFLQGLEIANPMRSLEEVTRHHLLRGELPLSELYDAEELDALLGAYTGYLVGTNSEHVTQVGDRSEGLITLPVSELKSYYE